MSPRTGRPPIENPKSDRITVRLDNARSMALEKCAQNIGTSKADIIGRGIDLLEIEDINPQARQLFDSIVVHYEIKQMEEKIRQDEYAQIIKENIRQIEFCFGEFLKSIR